MLKRVFGIVLLACLGILAWFWWRQRQAGYESQFPLLDSAPQTAPSRGSTAAADTPGSAPPLPTTPMVRAPEAAPAPQDVHALTDAPGEPLTEIVDDPQPNAAVMETPPAPMADERERELGGDEDGITAYCVRCREKRLMQDAEEETTENGRRAARGTCPVCGSTMFTFLPERDT